MNTRRDVLKLLAAIPASLALTPRSRADNPPPPAASPGVQRIERSIILEGRKSKATTWFHSRACVVPAGDSRSIFMTLQSIAGSDYFGPVHWMETKDLGKTWSDPQPIPGFGRRPAPDGLEEGVCDVVPDYHAATKSILAVGHSVFYKNNKLHNPQPSRHPVYVVRDAAGRWSDPQVLAWDDARGKQIYTCGCGQKVITPAGDVLIPISFGGEPKEPRAVATAKCRFDGKQLKIETVGKELRINKGRGFLEPSMTTLDNRYYLTIRAEDGHGYVAASDDGITWSSPTAWTWDDGSAIAMSTTQQHWLTHSGGLFLVYTRKAEENTGVFRWRSPIYIAAVDRKTLRLIRQSEQIVFPMAGDPKDPKHVAGMGNFHTVNASPDESWVTTGEERPNDGWHGDLLLARVRWNDANRLAS